MSNNRVDVHVGARTSELERGMENARDIVENASDNIERAGRNTDFRIDVSGVEQTFNNLSENISGQMLELGKRIVAGFVSTLAIDGLIELTKNTITTASEIQKMSELVGESVEDFQYFAKGAETAGLSLEQFGQMGKDALDRLGEARRGEGEMMDFFEKIAPKIGVTIDQFKELSGPEVIQAYYSGLEKANISHAEIITYMEQIVDDGSMLIPLLKDGGAGFKEWGDEAQNAGAIMSKDMVDNLGTVQESLNKLQLQFQGFQAVLINAITPAVTMIAKHFDTIRAIAVALGAAIAAKLIIQMSLLSIEFIKGFIEGVRYQMTLAAMAGQTITLTTATNGLRIAMMGLIGGPAGLAMLAVQAIAAGVAFLYMKRNSDDVQPSLSSQGKTVAELRAEYERLDQAQQRVLTRQATADLSKAEQGYRKQELALLGLVRAVIKHSDSSDTDKKKAQELYDQYLQGKLNADQLATGINNLRTVEAKHKAGIDEKAAAVNKERKAVIDAEGVLKTYNNTVTQGTKDNKDHTNSINDKANALANLTAKQLEYVQAAKTEDKKEAYTAMLQDQGFSREKAESYADSKEKSGTDYYAPMPDAVKASAEADWKRTQAAKAREEAEKKAEEKLKEQTKELEKQQQILQVNARVKANADKFNYSGIEQKHNLPSGMLSSIDMQESRGNSKAVGPTTKYGTAKGNFQMLDATAKRFGVTNPFDTKQAAEGAAKYLRFLLDKFGDIDKAISAYHAGEGNVERGTGIGPVNRQYVKNVKGYMAGVNGVEAGTESNTYDKSLQEQVRRAEEAEKEKLALQYKYANEGKKVALDLKNELEKIEKSSLIGEEKKAFTIKAEKDAAEKIKEIRIEQLEKTKSLLEEELQGKIILSERIYELEMAQIQASFDAGKISNVDKVKLEKQLQDNLTAIKRIGLEERLGLEQELGVLTGKSSAVTSTTNEIGALDNQKSIADIQSPALIDAAQMKDFEKKFGGLTSRMSGLWDKGIQSMMNGTLTWKNATNAIYTEMAGAFIQSMISEPLKKYAASLATRMAIKLGFIKTETAAEIAGQTAQTGAVVAGETTKTIATSTGALARLAIKAGEAIKSIMMYAWEAMAGAFKAMVSIPYIGPVLAVAAGASALALVGGIAGNIKSARGGYDIPSGVNPVTQLHEEEMVLPKQHANTIRALGRSMSGGGMSEQPAYAGDMGMMPNINIQAWDSKDVKKFMKKHGRELAGGLKSHRRGFGK